MAGHGSASIAVSSLSSGTHGSARQPSRRCVARSATPRGRRSSTSALRRASTLATMPVRFSTSSVLRWPEPSYVMVAARTWAVKAGAADTSLLAIGLFGSYARGDAGVGSDLHLMATFEGRPESADRRPRPKAPHRRRRLRTCRVVPPPGSERLPRRGPAPRASVALAEMSGDSRPIRQRALWLGRRQPQSHQEQGPWGCA